MNTKRMMLIAGVVLLILVVLFVNKSLTGNTLFSTEQQNAQVNLDGVTKDNFIQYVQQQKLISELPKDSVISLRLYNFDNGYREWEKSYEITRGNIMEGEAQNPDFDIIIHSKYIEDAARDICAAVKKADANGDFAADTEMSTLSIMWKYKSILEYRECFGV